MPLEDVELLTIVESSFRATFLRVSTRVSRTKYGTSSLSPAETLFSAGARKNVERSGQTPLAERMRPRTLEDLVGQKHLFGKGRGGTVLADSIQHDRVRSMILWGPPGVGKTTLGRIVAETTKARFVPFSAVLGSLPELRVIVTEARDRLAFAGERTIVFVDEIHRFNKAQQDAFLPHVESGTIT